MQSLNFLSLPVEIRLQIYSELFGDGKNVLDGGDRQQTSCFISGSAAPIAIAPCRSSQLLRTCKTILFEARPILYDNTVFHVIRHTFAGSLPSSISDGHGTANQLRHLIWQVESDILKRWYEDDLRFETSEDWANLKTLEIRCRVDAWRGSYCGDPDDRQAFANGRDHVLKYCEHLLHGMSDSNEKTFQRLSEDCRFNGKGEVRLRLTGRGWAVDPGANVILDLMKPALSLVEAAFCADTSVAQRCSLASVTESPSTY